MKENTIFWIVGIIVVVFLILPNFQQTSTEDFVSIKVHYYDQNRNEIDMNKDEVETKINIKNLFEDLTSSISLFTIGDFSLSWNFHSANDDAEGITTNGINIWVVDDDDFDVYKYTMSGSYISKWSLNSGQENPQGITTNGINIWVVDDTPGEESVFKYTMSGSYISRWLLRDASEVNGRPTGITTDGNSIWVVDYYNKVFKYTMSGSYVNMWFIQSPNILPDGITTDGNSIWVVDNTNDKAFRYSKNGVYFDFWSLHSGNVNPTGITSYGDSFWVSDEASSNERAFVYEGPCYPETCSSLGKQCGIWGDTCGGTLNCGVPLEGYICSAEGTIEPEPVYISFEVTATNTGEIPFEDLIISSASPTELFTALPTTTYDLPIGGSQTWISEQIEIKSEWASSTVFEICISGLNTFKQQSEIKCNSISGVL